MAARTLLLALLLSTSSPLAAQEPARQGFWWALGAGAASIDMDCPGCDQLADSIPYGPGGGFQVSAAAGGTVSDRLLIGGSVFAAARVRENRDATVTSVGAVARFYPRAEGRLFVRAAAGVSASTLAGGGTLVEAVGFGVRLDAGLELWRSGRRAIGPYAGVMLAANDESSASVAGPEQPAIGPPRHPRAIYVGLGAAWH